MMKRLTISALNIDGLAYKKSVWFDYLQRVISDARLSNDHGKEGCDGKFGNKDAQHRIVGDMCSRAFDQRLRVDGVGQQ
jgi:hypothetical protein